MGLAPIVNTSIPEATQWENKSRKHSTMNCVRFFLAATLVCMEAMADNSPELKGFNMFSSLLADKILENQIDELEEKRFLGMQGDAAYSSNMRITQAGTVWDIIRSSVVEFKA